jgi:4-amino-4-deoxy-L-arabinose transferase-like glycosyltransferase
VKKFHLYLLIALIFALSVVIRVLPAGFHPDSLVYMSMARNLSEGALGFWDLHFTDLHFNHFYEHPPLGIYIMSLFFSVFRDTIYIDRFFGSFFGILILIEIALIYKLITKSSSKNALLLAGFYFLAFPIVPFALENNLLEIPATFFILMSVYIFLYAAIKKSSSFLYPFLFSLALLGAFLVKGPVTLFPLALPFFYFVLFSKEYSLFAAAKFYILTAVSLLLFSFALYSYSPSNYYFSTYFHNQILSSLNGSRGGHDHFKLTQQVLLDFVGFFLISLAASFVQYKKTLKLSFSKMSWLFVFIGLSASLPLEISPRQSDYYLFPAYPFFAIALALVFTQPITALIKRFGAYKLIISLNVILLIAFLITAWYKVHDYRRHKDFYKDFIEAKVNIQRGSKIAVCAANAEDNYEFFNNTELPGNIERYYKADITDDNTTASYYLTTLKSSSTCKADPKIFKYIGPASPQAYLLYERVQKPLK